MEVYLIADSISAVCFSNIITAAVAPPPRKSSHLRTARRNLLRRRRRTRRRSDSGGENDVFCGDSGDGLYGGGGGGRGWNSGGFGWSNWEWEGNSSPADPAFDFVYEVMCWIALLNCLHYAFKKVVRIGGDSEREKLRMVPIC